MFKAYKYRIYPNKKQREQIDDTFNACRFVYNYFLQKQIDLYEAGEKRLSEYDYINLLTDLKKEETWLCNTDSKALQNAIKNLDSAYRNFFKVHSGFPKFKSENVYRQSYATTGCIHYLGKHIQLPKLGLVKTKNRLVPGSRILRAIISKEPSGKYYCSFSYTDVEIVPLQLTGSVAGLVLGIEKICITSDGNVYMNQNNLKQTLDKLAKLQCEMQRKEKESANYEKARIKVARLHERVANQRQDYLQKLTTELIRKYDVLYLEDPDIKTMMEECENALSLADASLYNFIFMLTYKAAYYGKTVIIVNKDVLLDTNTTDVEYLKRKANEVLNAGLEQQQEEKLIAA